MLALGDELLFARLQLLAQGLDLGAQLRDVLHVLRKPRLLGLPLAQLRRQFAHL